ncbi:hypothetical protein FEM48_Zijuj10G0044700 [Ziziphus jujuba var. spinosa]|uniref:CAAX prenyl protease 2/Lysostaphin resistance protein A-like domain-containing protein n=1 Tax=Ziziphus jujuba var. spinosa TaxID=714518 RepID=A0A978ULA7_ZIZJJ|nr:hypothetical protein FEM48_Zijuj10G0044700 [Ziziphus jujuba var. spinosa]
MGSLSVNGWWTRTTSKYASSSTNPLRLEQSSFICGNLIGLYGVQNVLPSKLCSGLKFSPRAFASRKSFKKLKKDGTQKRKSVTDSSSSDDYGQDDKKVDPSENLIEQKLISIPSRSSVLQACTVTSGLIAAFGIIIRQVSHLASVEGLPILDCSSKVSFDFEMWHLELITGLVLLISSCRYLLLKTWPDFAESSEAANQQVLTSLGPLDYMVVAFLPGFSEASQKTTIRTVFFIYVKFVFHCYSMLWVHQELLFRGALLPLFGFDWKSVLVVAAIFGVLHLGSGRKYSFAAWATFVGLAYGYATVMSSSIIVPMASHAVNNLVGGILWRYESKPSEQR